MIKVDTSIVPVSEKFREHANEIVREVYFRLRERISGQSDLFGAVLEVMVDYHDRSGEQFELFDEFQQEVVRTICDRVIDHTPATGVEAPVEKGKDLPVGFTREMLDALDHAVRYRKFNN